jgi:hypothetical protein
MGILDWFKNKKRFIRCDDMYATTRTGLWQSLRKTVDAPQHSQKAIWLIAHFPETFMALQDELETWETEFEVVTQPVKIEEFERAGLAQQGKVYLILAQLLQHEADHGDTNPFAKDINATDSTTIAMIMVERHPLISHDERLEKFGRAIPRTVEFGYFNSLDDEVLSHVINDTLLTILKQLGLNDHELITSTLVSRRLEKVLKRVASTYKSDLPADSAREWIKLNQQWFKTAPESKI